MQNSKIVFWLFILAIIGSFLYNVKEILSPFVASFIIAYLLNPVTVKLEQLGIKRTYTVSVIVMIFFSVFIWAFIKLAPALLEQAKEFISTLPKLETYLKTNLFNKFEHVFTKVDAKFGAEIHNQLSNIASKILNYFVISLSALFSSSLTIFTTLAFILFTPILVFYLLRDWNSLTNKIKKLVPLQSKKIIFEQLNQIDQVLSSCIRGQLSVCFIMAIYYIIALSLVGLNYSLLLGLLAGFGTIIPFIGFIFSMLLSLLIALIQFSDNLYIYLSLIIFVTGNILESYIITPKLVGQKIGLHPVWVIFALMAGGCLFGLWGMFFALPCAAIIGVLTKSITKIYLNSKFYSNS
jgi:putative permease